MNAEDQIKELNEQNKVTIGVSKIHGVGVIAIQDIKKGEKLYCVPQTVRSYAVPYEEFGKIHPEVRKLIMDRWGFRVMDGLAFGSPIQDAIHICFMNHSDNPNYQFETDSALKDIKKGEEVTENYKIYKNHKLIYPWI